MSLNGDENFRGKRRLRVVHCLRAPVGGLFRHVCDLAHVQSTSGYDVGILCADAPNDPMTVERLGQLKPHCTLGITRISLGRLPGISDVRALVSGARAVAVSQPDIVHGHGAKGGLLSRFLYSEKPVSRIYTPHGGSVHYSPLSPAGRVFGAAERFMLRRTDGLIFESEFARSVFTQRFGVLPDNTMLVHNGVGPDEFKPVLLNENAADFVFLGELRELKGIYTLLEAFKTLVQNISPTQAPATLEIVGSGPDETELRSRISSLGLEAEVRLRGVLPAREAFALGRVVVMPSHRDSFPYVALEAAAAKRPLIATHTGGIPEIFGPCSEMLLAPGDVGALAARMQEYLEGPASWSEVTHRMQVRVRSQFSLEKMATGVLENYSKALCGLVGGRRSIAGAPGVGTTMDVAK